MEIEGWKAEYFREQLEKGVRDIYEAQLLIATQRIYQVGSSRRLYQGVGRRVQGRSGELRRSLENPSYKLAVSGGEVELQARIPEYIRFLDMKKYGNFRIYNRQVWGILYKETLNNIKYEFRDWLKSNISRLLAQAGS